MSRVEGDRIVLPSANRIRSIPELPAPEYLEDQSVLSSAHSVGSVIRDALDELDNGCLITNIHRHSDERARMINAQRNDPQEKQEVVRLRNMWKSANLTIL